jgi:YVTN family beta-propeller protein
MRAANRWVAATIAALSGVAVALPAVPAAEAASTDPRATEPMARAVAIARARIGSATTPSAPAELHASSTAPATSSAPFQALATPAAAAPATADAPLDVTPRRGDLTAVGARLTDASIRLTATVPTAPDPSGDLAWKIGDSGLLWFIDAGANGIVEKAAILIGTPNGKLLAAVLTYAPNPTRVCAGNATFGTGGVFTATFPASCVGSPARIAMAVSMDYDNNTAAPGLQGMTDFAPDVGLTHPIERVASTPSTAGVLAVTASGTIAKVKLGASPGALTGPTGVAGTSVRGIATTPDGGHGYVLDGTGALHPFGIGRNEIAAAAYKPTRWYGDVARGVAIRPNGSSGFVVDAHGALHPFGIGVNRAVPKLYGVKTWPGADMARGVAVLPNGLGGFTLDAHGGLHWFSIGQARGAPAVFGLPTFPGDGARGLTILPDRSGGFVLERNGTAHWFSIGTAKPAPALGAMPNWAATNNGRAIAVVTGLIAPPPPPVDPLVTITGGVTDVVINDAGALAYASSPSTSSVKVIDLGAKAVVGSIPLSGAPKGLDLTPDGTRLYTANTNSTLSVVDVATRTQLRTIPVPHLNTHPELVDYPASIRFASNGTALVALIHDGSGYGGHVLQLKLADDSLMVRIDAGSSGEPPGGTTTLTRIERSRDRSTLSHSLGGGSQTQVFLYHAATDSFTKRNLLAHINTALDAHGSRLLLNGRFLFDSSFTKLLQLEEPTDWGALSDDGATIYRVVNRSLQTVQVSPAGIVDRQDVGDTVTNPHHPLYVGRIALAPAGDRAVVITDHGVSILPL